jgi:hypothetical protein
LEGESIRLTVTLETADFATLREMLTDPEEMIAKLRSTRSVEWGEATR